MLLLMTILEVTQRAASCIRLQGARSERSKWTPFL